MNTLKTLSRRSMVAVGISSVALIGTVIGVSPVGPGTSSAAPPAGAGAVGGITQYEAKITYQSIAVGPHARPTLVLSRSVPAGKYLVNGWIGVNAQSAAFIVCAVSNAVNGNDGVFGTFYNGAATTVTTNVGESEVVTVKAGQSINLMCDDNSNLAGNTISEAVIEATPVKPAF